MMIMNTAAGGEAGASVRRNGPFTATQWQQLEHQALAYKYMISGLPIPPHLLFTIKTHHHQPHHPSIGWKMMGFGRKEIRIINDPEPGRCRRTDGKKWRCSKEAYTDSKYCQRHMHRGRNRSRKQPTVVKSSSNYHNNNNISHAHVSSNANLDSSPYRKRYGMKQEHSFFSESSGTINTSFTKQTTLSGYCDQLALKLDGKDEPQKIVMHHFFDEWPPNHKESSTTQFSISIPSSAHHCN